MPVRIPSDVAFEVLDGEAVVLNLQTGVYFQLNEVGTRVWELLSVHGEAEPIVDALFEEYEVERATLTEDVDRLISELSEKGLLVAE